MNALELNDIEHLVSFTEIADLIEARVIDATTEHGLIVYADVTAADFHIGKKYTVGPTSFYIEAAYNVTSRMKIKHQTTFNYLQSLAPPMTVQQLFPHLKYAWHGNTEFEPTQSLALGAPLTMDSFELPTLVPQITIQEPPAGDYNVVLAARLSLRTTNGLRESLELDQIAIQSIDKATETVAVVNP